MPASIHNLYQKIRESLTADHLKKITVDILGSYRRRDFRRLRKYAAVLDLGGEVQDAKLFSTLVMSFHPDRLSLIMKRADALYGSGDEAGLRRLHDGYFFDIPAARYLPGVEVEERYEFDADEFGYHEEDLADMEGRSQPDLEYEEEGNSFVDAVRRLYAGGLDITIDETDLMNLEGALDLSDYDIEDLEGVQHCRYVSELNLSNNRIEKIGRLAGLAELVRLYLANNLVENIRPLEGLVHLKELDLSFNNISDISPLEKLGELEYVNLLGNPVRDFSVVDRLVKRGIIVIFEGNILT